MNAHLNGSQVVTFLDHFIFVIIIIESIIIIIIIIDT